MSWPSLNYRAAKLAARKDLSQNQRVMEDERDLRFWTNVGLGIAVALGIVVVVIHCWSAGAGAVTTGMAAFGSALGSGGVLGFLFGVPGAKPPVTNNITGPVAVSAGAGSKATNDAPAQVDPTSVDPTPINPDTPPAQSSAPPSAGTVTYDPGVSNLEQVADWVTKLLLGGGLTQMQRIPPLVWRWARIIAIGITSDQTNNARLAAEQAFGAGLLVYGFVTGFFCGYLITKLQIGKAIAE